MAQLRLRVAVALMALAGLAGLAAAQPLTNSFVYQGELRSADSLFDGLADIRVTLWTAEIDGVQVGVTQEAVGVDVVGGRFAVLLNASSEFGAAAFNGQRRWIELSVRAAGTGEAYEMLSPRQEVTMTPYAAYAANAGTLGGLTPAQLRDAGSLTGTLPDAALSSNIPLRTANQTFSGANTFTGANVFNNAGNTYAGSGAALTSLNASSLASGTIPDLRLSANVAMRNVGQTFTGVNVFSGANLFSNPGNSFSGNGAGLTNLNASNIVSGVLSDLQLSTNVAFRTATQTFLGANTFNGPSIFNAMASFNDRIGVGTTPSNQFRMHLYGGSGQWKGGVAASGDTLAVVMGELNGRATIGSNDAAFQYWSDLNINPVGGSVVVGGGSQTQPGGTLQIASGTGASASPYTGYVRVGPTGGQSLVLDTDELSSQTTNGVAATLRLNRLGGDVVVGGNLIVPSIQFGDGTAMTSAPRVQQVVDSSVRVVPAGGWIEYNLQVPGARPGMGIIVNPVGALESFDVLASARYSGTDFIQIRIQNTGSSATVYVNRSWIVTLIPAP